MRCKVVHCKREPYDVLIDRSTEWGNQFCIGPDGTRADVIRKHRAWLMVQPKLVRRVHKEFAGKTLGCWCAPKPCHGDTYAEVANRKDGTMKAPKMKLVFRKLSKLKRWKKNPRVNKEAAKRLKKLIKANGFRVPLIIDSKNRIWSGDTRYQVAQLLGMKKVPCIVTDFDNRGKAVMFALGDNKSSEWAQWDPDLLKDAFKKHDGIDLSALQRMTGFSAPEIEKLRGTDDLPNKPPGFGDDDLPEPLDSSELAGGDGAEWNRFIIAFRGDEEREKLVKMLGVSGKKTVYTLDDLNIGGERKTIRKKRGKISKRGE